MKTIEEFLSAVAEAYEVVTEQATWSIGDQVRHGPPEKSWRATGPLGYLASDDNTLPGTPPTPLDIAVRLMASGSTDHWLNQLWPDWRDHVSELRDTTREREARNCLLSKYGIRAARFRKLLTHPDGRTWRFEGHYDN